MYGEDKGAIGRAARGGTAVNRMAAYASTYAQARFSAFANVHWCVVNDVLMKDQVNLVAAFMRAREPWGTLMTSHQMRYTGYYFVASTWSDMVVLQTLDAVWGLEVAQFRALQPDPVIVEEVGDACDDALGAP